MSSSHEHLDSGVVEYYTPSEIVEAARIALGGTIMLDPASCDIANARIGACMFYTKEQNGLRWPWFGTVWMNHPFGRGVNGDWVDKLVASYKSGAVLAACCITWASMSELWFRPLLDYPHCIPYGRTHYMQPDGTGKRGANKGSVITYLGPDVAVFAEAFKDIGSVYIPYRD